jgi:hypothetical protein
MANSAKMLEDDKDRVASGAMGIGDAVTCKPAGFGFTIDGGPSL